MRWSRNATSSALTFFTRATHSRSIVSFEIRGTGFPAIRGSATGMVSSLMAVEGAAAGYDSRSLLRGPTALAYRRTQDVGREEILSRQPAGKDRPAHVGGHRQGAMDLRAGSPAAERRTRSRPLRGLILATRPSSSCAHDDDRVRLLQHRRLATARRKKESTGHRPSRLCLPCATP